MTKNILFVLTFLVFFYSPYSSLIHANPPENKNIASKQTEEDDAPKTQGNAIDRALHEETYLQAERQGKRLWNEFEDWLVKTNFSLETTLPELRKISSSLKSQQRFQKLAEIGTFFTKPLGFSFIEKQKQKERILNWIDTHAYVRFRDVGVMPEEPLSKGMQQLIACLKRQEALQSFFKTPKSQKAKTRITPLISILMELQIEAEQGKTFEISSLVKSIFDSLFIPEHQTWINEHLKSGREKIPAQIRVEGFKKLLMTLLNVMILKLESMHETLPPAEFESQLFRAMQAGFYFGLSYPLMDDVMDSTEVLSPKEKQDATALIVECLSGTPLDELKIPPSPLARDMVDLFTNLSQLYPTEKNPELYQSLLVLTLSQNRDQMQPQSGQIKTMEELILPIMLKSTTCQIISRHLIHDLNPEILKHCHLVGLFNQLSDDLEDIEIDLKSGTFSAFTYFLKNPDKTSPLRNPLEIFFGLAYFLGEIHQNQTHTKAQGKVIRDLFLSRALFKFQNYAKGVDEKTLHLFFDSVKLDKGSKVRQKLLKLAAKPALSDFGDGLLSHLYSTCAHLLGDKATDLIKSQCLSDFSKQYLPLIHKNLQISKQELTNPQDLQEIELTDAMNYSLVGPGKRLRPLLLLLTAREFKIEPEAILPHALAIEYAHTASLVFDDLPAQDNASLRRGRKTLHQAYRESTAQLAGLSLILEAIRKSLENGKDFDSKAAQETTLYLVQAMGRQGLSLGQIKDLWRSTIAPTRDEIRNLIHLKTGMGIEAALMAPALLAQQSTEIQERIRLFSKHLGLTFQLRDDLLDIEGNPQLTGKDTQIDTANETPSYPQQFGVEETKLEIKKYQEAALEDLTHLPFQSPIFSEIVNFAATRSQ